jgi:hypothetical protein
MVNAHRCENSGVYWGYGKVVDRIAMTYQRRCELPRSDVQNLDARVAGYAHKRVTIFSLGPNDAVVIELLIARSRVIS